MDRLTKKIPGGVDMFGQPIVGTYECDMTPGKAAIKVRCTLGRYEDTNLTPKEIDSVKADLAAYQATGLTPEQVAELLPKWKQLESDRDAYKKDYGAAIEILAERTADRDAWKRRAEAAIADLNELRKRTGWKCAYCEYDKNYVREVCAGCGYNNDNNWDWCGPRDEGKEG